MLATARTVCSATRVKSGPATVAATGALRCASAAASGAVCGCARRNLVGAHASRQDNARDQACEQEDQGDGDALDHTPRVTQCAASRRRRSEGGPSGRGRFARAALRAEGGASHQCGPSAEGACARAALRAEGGLPPKPALRAKRPSAKRPSAKRPSAKRPSGAAGLPRSGLNGRRRGAGRGRRPWE